MSEIPDRLSEALSDRYSIERELGEGGMATVYLAHDLKHHRQVAIKLLKPELAAVVGKERFFTEIQTTAQLQHPHILPLHDSGEADGLLYYVMPYVQGETLADWLARERQLPVDTALDVTRKLAAALDYAHERGVVHRDIKPANVLISSGEPLIADFGIALAVSRAGGGRITETGLSLGTPHYMSPEQASGDRSLDPRSDVYALGCVLYEMLIGEPPFPGPSAQAVLARILTSAPARVTLGRPTVPAHVDSVVARALEKLPADRFASAGDLRKAIDDPSFRHTVAEPSGPHVVVAPTPAPAPAPRRIVPAALAAVAILAIAGGAWGWLRPLPDAPVQRLRLDVQTFPENGSEIAVSPDGTRIVYVGADRRLYLRPLSSLESQPIPGTEGARGPFFSPDGLSIGFNMGSPDRIHTLALSGGTPVPVGNQGDPVDVQAAWSDDGYIYYMRDGGGERGILRAPAQGGAAERIPAEEVYALPVTVPGVTDKILVRADGAGVGFLDVADGAFRAVDGLERATDARVARGHVFWRAEDGTLSAARFDAAGESLTSPPVTLARAVGPQDLAISESGVLVYVTGGAAGESEALAWISPDGQREAVDTDLSEALAQFEGVRISPDGRYLALEVQRGGAQGQEYRIFLYDSREATWQQLTFEGRMNVAPRWLPDGRVAFLTNQGGNWEIWAKPFDRSADETLLISTDAELFDFETSPIEGDPMAVVLDSVDGASSPDIFLVDPVPGAELRPLITTRFDEKFPAISPDGRWIAYSSDESGDDQIYIRSFPEGGRPWPITLEPSLAPAWGATSSELFYDTREGLKRARLDLSDGVRVESREAVPWRGDEEVRNADEATYDVAADGRLLVIVAGDPRGVGDTEEPGARLPVVVLNVFREIEERLAMTGGR